MRLSKQLFLSPAPEGWGKVMFSVCVSIHWGGGRGFPSLWSHVLSRMGVRKPIVTGPFEGVLQARIGILLTQDRGIPRTGLPHPGQETACSCYAAGNTPLAVTEEDCPVLHLFWHNENKQYFFISTYLSIVCVGKRFVKSITQYCTWKG